MNITTPKVAALPTIRRLPHYLRILKELRNNGEQLVSGTFLAQRMQCEPIQVRKDLAATGTIGRPRIGFDIVSAINSIELFLGWDNTHDAFLIGAGSLGSAILGYDGFAQHNLNIVAAFDTDSKKVGNRIHGKEVFALDKISDLASRLHVHIGILTVPALAAQTVTDYLINCNIKGIWNFSPIKLTVPSDVIVQYEDLSSGLAVLCRRINAIVN